MGVVRRASVWILQTALAALLLFLLWHPALSVSTLKPQQNIVAVVVDDSTSMTTDDENSTRKEAAEKILNGGLLKALQEKFQVRLYRMSDHAERIDKLEQLTAGATATHIGDSLKQVAADASSLPIGAMVLLSDGADNTGGVDLETMSEIRRQRIPVHTIGLGRETMSHDIEISNVDVAARALPESRLGATVSFHQHGYTGQKAKITLKEGSKVVASQDVTLKGEGTEQVETVLFNAGDGGREDARSVHRPVPERRESAQQSRHAAGERGPAQAAHPLYGRRAALGVQVPAPRRRGRQEHRPVHHPAHRAQQALPPGAEGRASRGLTDANELKDGFPSKVEELFGFDGIIFGSVDAPYLTKNQQDMVKQFVDRRGGGVLFLGGKDSLSDGGWAKSADADILPTTLPERKNTYSFAGADVELTPDGPRQPDHAHRRRSRQERGALEEAALHPDVPGSGRAQAGRGGAGELHSARRRRGEAAAAGDHELRPRAHRDLRHRRKLALADAAAGGRHVARDVLSPVAALGGERHAAAHHRLDAQDAAGRRIARQAAGRGSRQDLSAGLRRDRRSAHHRRGRRSRKRST